MTAVVTQIVKAYETLHLDLEEIAREVEVSIFEVKSVLNQYSQMYRMDCKEDKDLDFSDDELLVANSTIVKLMNSEDDHVALRAATFVRDDKKGRKEVKSALKSMVIDVLEFNERIRRMQLASGNPGPSVPLIKEKELIDV